MSRLGHVLVLTGLIIICSISVVNGSENVTLPEVPIETLVNLTGNNDLWAILLRDCDNPTLACVQNNIFRYLKQSLDETDDWQFNSFLKFTKNNLDYGKIQRSFETDTNNTSEEYMLDEEFPIQSMSRSLQDNAARFFITHDLEVSLPDGLFPDSVLKIAPRGFEDRGALVNLEIVSKDLETGKSLEEGSRTFKKIRNFITQNVIYALLAILLVIKLLAVKFLFLLPLIVGAATAKKLLFKVLLFVFPFLHHIFKFCAYYPVQAKYHHHKHLISHIHEVAPPKHHDHYEGIEVISPHGYGPPTDHHGYHEEHFSEFGDDISVLPDDGSGFPHGNHWFPTIKTFAIQFGWIAISTARKIIHFLAKNLISHRKDPTRDDNEVSPYGHVSAIRRRPSRPLTSREIERMIAKAEKEAIIKARLERERIRIREENLRLQEELNRAIKHQEKLKQQAVYLHKKLPPTKITSSVPYGNKPSVVVNPPPLKGSPFDLEGATHSRGPGIKLPDGYIPEHTVPQKPQSTHPIQENQHDNKYQSTQQDHFEQQYQASLQNKFEQQYQSSQVNTQNQASSIGINQGPVYRPAQHSSPTSSNDLPASSAQVDFRKSIEYDPRVGVFDNSKEVLAAGNDFKKYQIQRPVEGLQNSQRVDKPIATSKPELEQEIYQAASITYDQFYSPILQKIDKVLQGLGFNEEPCRERLICSMYKNPNKYSPHSNLLSAELSRDSSELQKPTSTNSVVIRFYKYVQAARDGQDQRDCLRLYPSCSINTEL